MTVKCVKEPVWVLQACNSLSFGGVYAFLMNYYQNINRSEIQFAFCVQRDFELPYDKEILAMGGRIHRVPRMKEHPLQYIRTLKNILHEHSEYKIIHAHMNHRNAIPLFVAKQVGVPVRISHAHSGGSRLSVMASLRLIILHMILRMNATDYWTCSQSAADYHYHNSTIANKPIRIVPNAIKASQYVYDEGKRVEIRSRLGLSNNFVIGHVGDYSYQKNYPFLFKIFKEIVDKKPNSRLMLIGDGPHRENILNEARSLGIDEYLLVLGRRTDVDFLMQGMDAFCFPSHHEGLGIVTIEAQAAGLPTFVSDHVPPEVDITDLVVHLALENNVAQWQDAICQSEKRARRNRYDEIVAAGFDIEDNSLWLEMEYKMMYERKDGI